MNLKKRLFFIFLIFFSFCPVKEGLSEEGDKTRSTLVFTIRSVKPGIVAIGTYDFRDVPKAQFRGTGFMVGDGKRLVTNAHTIAQIESEKKINQLRIFHKDVESSGLRASLLETDPRHDLALLKIEGGNLPPLRLGDSSGVREGEAVAFTGYPIGLVLGLNPTTHTGIISAISPIVLPPPSSREIPKDIIEFLRQPFDIFQIDATAYPGNSGSPVYRISDGLIIGVINMVFVKGKKEHILKDPTGITYAIPIDFVKSMLNKHQDEVHH